MNRNFAGDALRRGLEKRPSALARAVMLVLAAAVFFVFARYARYAQIDEYSGTNTGGLAMITAAMYTAIYLVSYAVQLHTGRRLPVYMHVLLAFITGLVLLGKISRHERVFMRCANTNDLFYAFFMRPLQHLFGLSLRKKLPIMQMTMAIN